MALPLKAHIASRGHPVRFVPQADIRDICHKPSLGAKLVDTGELGGERLAVVGRAADDEAAHLFGARPELVAARREAWPAFGASGAKAKMS